MTNKFEKYLNERKTIKPDRLRKKIVKYSETLQEFNELLIDYENQDKVLDGTYEELPSNILSSLDKDIKNIMVNIDRLKKEL